MTSIPCSAELFQVLSDRLYLELSKCKSDSVKQGPVYVRRAHGDILVFDSRKYYDQAHDYEHAIIAALEGKPVPHFIISLSDLSLELRNELDSVDSWQLSQTLTTAILKIFQDLDDNYNQVFSESDRKNRINLCKEVAKIIRVKLV